MEEIIRNFKMKREHGEMIYPFTTYSCVFSPAENEIVNKLFTYLASLITNGHPDFSGKISASEAGAVILQTEERPSDLIEYAKKSNYRGRQNGQHYCVQRYLLENDPNTIAIEVPVWDEKFSGHIDILRLLKIAGTIIIEIADFKPKAGREQKASTQLFRYKNSLAKRTGIPLCYFRCVYFDDLYSYFLT